MTNTDHPDETPEPSPILLATSGDFEGLDLETFMASAGDADEWLLRRHFAEAAEAAKTRGAEGHARALDLVAHLIGLPLRPEDPAGPFGARRVDFDARSHIASDFRGEQSRILAEVSTNIGPSMIRARLADVAWENDHSLTSAGQTAVAAYVENVRQQLEKEADEGLGVDRSPINLIHRAMQISARLHGRRKMPDIVSEAFRSVMEAARRRTDFSAYNRLAQIGAEHGVMTWAEIAPQAEALALSPGPESWAMARKMAWALAAEAYRRSGNAQAATSCTERMVDLTLQLREDVALANAKAYWTRMAIGELRRGKGSKDRIRTLRAELRDLQDEGLDEFVSQPIPLDLDEDRQAAFDLYANFDLAEALLQFALIVDPINPDTLREEARESLNRFAFKRLFGNTYSDLEGKTTSETGAPAEDPGDDWFKENALTSLDIHRAIAIGGSIDPARQAISDRFPIEQRHFGAIVAASPFIPSGHEYLFALGFARFFQGDLATAVYLLTPLIEHGIRHVMLNSGIDTSKMKPNLLQQDRTLSALLTSELRPDMDRIFGADLMFDVEMLFVHQPGPGLRHQVAHGMLPAGGCFHPNAGYGCWLVYRLTCLPLVRYWRTSIGPAIHADL